MKQSQMYAASIIMVLHVCMLEWARTAWESFTITFINLCGPTCLSMLGLLGASTCFLDRKPKPDIGQYVVLQVWLCRIVSNNNMFGATILFEYQTWITSKQLLHSRGTYQYGIVSFRQVPPFYCSQPFKSH